MEMKERDEQIATGGHYDSLFHPEDGGMMLFITNSNTQFPHSVITKRQDQYRHWRIAVQA